MNTATAAATAKRAIQGERGGGHEVEQCARLARHDAIGLEDDERQQRESEGSHEAQQHAQAIDALHSVWFPAQRLRAGPMKPLLRR